MRPYIDSIRRWVASLLDTKTSLAETDKSDYTRTVTKVFVSCQIEEKEAVRKAYAAFTSAGMSITHDWTQTDDIGDKLTRPDEAGHRARLDIEGVCECDIYVLLSSNQKVGKGMYVELGAALALSQTGKRPEVFVVGPMNHVSIFYLHPAVKHYQSVDDLIFDLSSHSGRAPELSSA